MPNQISQIAVVVRDLDVSMGACHELLGWGPWNVYKHVPRALHTTQVRGEPVEFSMLGAECDVDGIGFELVQRLTGPTIYQEFLDKHGEGVQDIAVMKQSQEESDEFKKKFAEAGASVLMGGRIGETIEFPYLDTTPTLEFVLESGSRHAIDLTPSRQYP